MSTNNGNGKHDDHDTLPALPPDAPGYAHVMYDIMMRMLQDIARVEANQTIVHTYLRDPSTHRRLLAALPPLYEPEPSDEVTRPGRGD